MGFKRTFDAEDVQELNVKHARQISYCNKLAKLDEGVPYRVSLEKSGDLGEDISDLCGFKCEDFEKGFKTNVPFSWITTGLCEEDAQSGATTQSSLSHESPELDSPWRPVSPEEDVYRCPVSPRKPVPVGPDYQADIPECVKEEARDQSGHAVGCDERQVTGKCIIPLPDCETEVCEAGKGRKECICLDKGSVRCVQQHIMENREDLFETIGYDGCLNLGLCDMGEEVAGKLTEDEDLFHEIVYSNPASLDRDFWKQLKSAFPLRTMKEIVSYYFNVFILRRRAVQNRSKSLDVDSDDDEWQIEYDNTFYGVETPSDEKAEKSLSRDEQEEEVNTNEDSSTSFEYQSNVTYSRCPVRNREESDIGNYWRHYSDLVDNSYSFDPCDSILSDHCWDKNIDLLPTSNIIDEIFGQDPWDDFSRGK
ncbi:AT-rich interactive domain-containing protein 2 [Cardamine amara subsp. amara]|uniref:AT-rich interactive domain-containing protein 2 n=1 Tax=Cardamine amara subsp. amara TaxID=228776 RepID=A0ABD1BS62_CARAN